MASTLRQPVSHLFRRTTQASSFHFRATARQSISQLRYPTLRRLQSTVAQEAKQTINEGAKQAEQSGFQKLWNSPVGPKTVHFWAPIMKWCLVLAGIADFARPAESLSLTQNAALMATGAIWTRWCFIIKPRNLFLAAVNFFLFLVGTTQVTRVLLYQQAQKDKTLGEGLKDVVKEEADVAKGIAKDPKGALQTAEKTN